MDLGIRISRLLAVASLPPKSSISPNSKGIPTCITSFVFTRHSFRRRAATIGRQTKKLCAKAARRKQTLAGNHSVCNSLPFKRLKLLRGLAQDGDRKYKRNSPSAPTSVFALKGTKQKNDLSNERKIKQSADFNNKKLQQTKGFRLRWAHVLEINLFVNSAYSITKSTILIFALASNINSTLEGAPPPPPPAHVYRCITFRKQS